MLCIKFERCFERVARATIHVRWTFKAPKY